MTDMNQIHNFAIKWFNKFRDKNTNYIELVDHYMADDCKALGFVMDCGHAFTEKYGDAANDFKALERIIDQVTDISLLGSAIYSQWRYFNHWAYSGEEILEPENRAWFTMALNRLGELAYCQLMLHKGDSQKERIISNIEIKKISITKADVDCVVNAANSGLWEGGGVCGAIFKEAGSKELSVACNAIGGCDEGCAVLTPGFNLKAKYIIHAVGPRWAGGKQGEEKKLYDCYQASMKLAEDYHCRSIAFPLISSGIFGYPKEEAWKIAIRSIRDYLSSHAGYDPQVVFAVLDDSVKAMGERILGESSQKGFGSLMYHIVRFHLTNEENGYLSNWYLRDFTIDGKNYCCVEQYMMEQKALLFADYEIAEQIMKTRDQKRMQDLGRAVRNFVSVIWDGRKQLIVYTGIIAKFEQNPDLLGRLISTGTATLVECSRSDKIWGIGMGMDDPDAANPAAWKGQNLLGFTLMAARTELTRRMLKAATSMK